MTLAAGPESRAVSWGGLRNARDLGGLPTASGRATRRGAIFRSGRLDPLDAAGWDALLEAGVRTVVDLRSEREISDVPRRPATVSVTNAPIEDEATAEFFDSWQARAGGPGTFLEVLDHWPHRVVGALRAIADAPGGGVVIHCFAGRDRTGLVSALLLTAAGVPRREVLDDYEAGVRGMNDSLVGQVDPPERLRGEEELATALVTSRDELDDFLDRANLDAMLHAGGGEPDLLARAASRLG